MPQSAYKQVTLQLDSVMIKEEYSFTEHVKCQNFGFLTDRFHRYCHLRQFVRPLVRQSRVFLRITSLDFSDFLHEVRGLQMLKSDGARFMWKIHFCPNLVCSNRVKIGYVPLFLKKFYLFFPKTMQNGSSFDS